MKFSYSFISSLSWLQDNTILWNLQIIGTATFDSGSMEAVLLICYSPKDKRISNTRWVDFSLFLIFKSLCYKALIHFWIFSTNKSVFSVNEGDSRYQYETYRSESEIYNIGEESSAEASL